MKLLVALALLCGFASAKESISERDLNLIEEFTSENFGYGDDGVDCEISTFSHTLLSESGSLSTDHWHRLYTFGAEQSLQPHGCGMRFTCHALIRSKTHKGAGEVLWGHCN